MSLHPDLAALVKRHGDCQLDRRGRICCEFDDHGLTAFALALIRIDRKRCADAICADADILRTLPDPEWRT